MVMVQVPDAAIVLGVRAQLCETWKSVAFVPLAAMLVMVRAVLPELVRMMDCVAVPWPTGDSPKVRLDGL